MIQMNEVNVVGHHEVKCPIRKLMKKKWSTKWGAANFYQLKKSLSLRKALFCCTIKHQALFVLCTFSTIDSPMKMTIDHQILRHCLLSFLFKSVAYLEFGLGGGGGGGVQGQSPSGGSRQAPVGVQGQSPSGGSRQAPGCWMGEYIIKTYNFLNKMWIVMNININIMFGFPYNCL